MEEIRDEDLMYESFEEMETTAAPKERPLSSTGSISDGEHSLDDSTQLKKTVRANERRTIDWSDDDLEEETTQKRTILVPRRLNEVPSSRFGIEAPAVREEVSEDLIDELYDGLEVDTFDPQIRLSSLFVHALKPITVYEVEKIFAEYSPTRCALLSAKTAVLKFDTERVAAEALIGLTKRLVCVRKESAQEDGELNDEEADESDTDRSGRLKPPRIVLLRKDGSRRRKQLVNTVELDVDDVEVPVGQWQVVVKHVPKGRHIFIRFALGSEVRQSIINPYKQEVTENPSNPDADAEAFKGYNKQRIKPGINVFKEDGTELPWDFEHDTRFYEQSEDAEEKERETFESKTEEIVTKSGEKIKSRGRGAKKFKLAMLDSDSD